MEAQGIPGTLRVYGCAAEETEGAKVYMARDGLFDDLDACLHWHPAPVAGVMNMRLAAGEHRSEDRVPRPQTAHAGVGAVEGTQRAGRAGAGRPRRQPDARAPGADGAHPLHLRGRRRGAERRARLRAHVADACATSTAPHVVATTEWVRADRRAARRWRRRPRRRVDRLLRHARPAAEHAARRADAAHLERSARRPGPTRSRRSRVRASGRWALAEHGLATRRRAAAAGDDDGRLVRRRRRELDHADDGHRDADLAARREPAHLAGDGLRRHVDRRARARSPRPRCSR